MANNEGPALSLPEFRHGVEVAVDYVNANGGINGAEIEIIECINDGSPEGSVNCANQFVDEGAVAYFAAIDVGADAALPILTSAGIPYVSTEPWGATQKTDPNSWILAHRRGRTPQVPCRRSPTRAPRRSPCTSVTSRPATTSRPA